MIRCTIRISSHDLTHHSVLPYRNNHATSPDVATLQLTSLSILNYTATISPLPPRLPTSPPFRNTIPSTPSVSFCYISQVPLYLLAPWQLQSVLPTKAAKNTSMTDYNLWEVWFPRTHDQKSLTLRWRSFSWWGREGTAICFAYKGSQ